MSGQDRRVLDPGNQNIANAQAQQQGQSAMDNKTPWGSGTETGHIRDPAKPASAKQMASRKIAGVKARRTPGSSTSGFVNSVGNIFSPGAAQIAVSGTNLQPNTQPQQQQPPISFAAFGLPSSGSGAFSFNAGTGALHNPFTAAPSPSKPASTTPKEPQNTPAPSKKMGGNRGVQSFTMIPAVQTPITQAAPSQGGNRESFENILSSVEASNGIPVGSIGTSQQGVRHGMTQKALGENRNVRSFTMTPAPPGQNPFSDDATQSTKPIEPFATTGTGINSDANMSSGQTVLGQARGLLPTSTMFHSQSTPVFQQVQHQIPTATSAFVTPYSQQQQHPTFGGQALDARPSEIPQSTPFGTSHQFSPFAFGANAFGAPGAQQQNTQTYQNLDHGNGLPNQDQHSQPQPDRSMDHDHQNNGQHSPTINQGAVCQDQGSPLSISGSEQSESHPQHWMPNSNDGGHIWGQATSNQQQAYYGFGLNNPSIPPSQQVTSPLTTQSSPFPYPGRPSTSQGEQPTQQSFTSPSFGSLAGPFAKSNPPFGRQNIAKTTPMVTGLDDTQSPQQFGQDVQQSQTPALSNASHENQQNVQVSKSIALGQTPIGGVGGTSNDTTEQSKSLEIAPEFRKLPTFGFKVKGAAITSGLSTKTSAPITLTSDGQKQVFAAEKSFIALNTGFLAALNKVDVRGDLTCFMRSYIYQAETLNMTHAKLLRDVVTSAPEQESKVDGHLLETPLTPRHSTELFPDKATAQVALSPDRSGTANTFSEIVKSPDVAVGPPSESEQNQIPCTGQAGDNDGIVRSKGPSVTAPSNPFANLLSSKPNNMFQLATTSPSPRFGNTTDNSHDANLNSTTIPVSKAPTAKNTQAFGVQLGSGKFSFTPTPESSAGAGNTGFLGQFAQHAAKFGPKDRVKRRTDDFDSDEGGAADEERGDIEKQFGKKRKIEEPVQGPGFQPRLGAPSSSTGFMSQFAGAAARSKAKEDASGTKSDKELSQTPVSTPCFAAQGLGIGFMAQFAGVTEQSAAAEKAKRKAEEFDSENEDEDEWERRDAELQAEKKRKIAIAASAAAFKPIFAARPSNTGFMAQFAGATQKSAAADKAKRKAEDFDSDDDEDEWERLDAERQAEKSRKIVEAAQGKRVKFTASGFAFQRLEADAPESDKSVEQGTNDSEDVRTFDQIIDLANGPDVNSQARNTCAADADQHASEDLGDCNVQSGGHWIENDAVANTDGNEHGARENLKYSSEQITANLLTEADKGVLPVVQPATADLPSGTTGLSGKDLFDRTAPADSRHGTESLKGKGNPSKDIFDFSKAFNFPSAPFSPSKDESIGVGAEQRESGDHTWKTTTPIKFGNWTDPKMNITANSSTTDSSSNVPSATNHEPKRPLSSLFSIQPPSKTEQGLFSNPSNFSALPKLVNGSMIAAKDSSLLSATMAGDSANTSRGTSPGTGTDLESTGGFGDEDIEEVHEQADFNAIPPDEIVLFEQEGVKAYLNEHREWQNKGVGVLRLLKNKTSGGGSAFMRMIPSGKVVFNARIQKQLSCKTSSKTSVTIPLPTADGKLQSWLLQFGKGQDETAARFLQSANDVRG